MIRDPKLDPQYGDILVSDARGWRQVMERTDNTVCYLVRKRSVLKGTYKAVKYCVLWQWQYWCRAHNPRIVQRGEKPIVIVERPKCAAPPADSNTTEMANASAMSATLSTCESIEGR